MTYATEMVRGMSLGELVMRIETHSFLCCIEDIDGKLTLYCLLQRVETKCNDDIMMVVTS
jgi:hypothetical protein